MKRLVMMLVLVVPLCGCTRAVNLRSVMEEQVRPGDGLQQTQFAHIGQIETVEGTFQVTTQRLVSTGAMSPRGQGWMFLFDERGQLAARHSLLTAAPLLWCEGSRIYMWGMGFFPGATIDPRIEAITPPDRVPVGNVVDFSRGIERPMLTREKRYGRSGGIEADPWAK